MGGANGIVIPTLISVFCPDVFVANFTFQVLSGLSGVCRQAFSLDLELQIPERLPLLGSNAFYVELAPGMQLDIAVGLQP